MGSVAPDHKEAAAPFALLRLGQAWGDDVIPERTLGEIDANCYMVQRGKPAAMIPVQERFLDTVTQVITETHGLSVYVEGLALGWANVWVYQYPHILHVIKALQQGPETVFEHWILGKLFGYSEEAIQDFLRSLDLNV